jgi:hypothetical protein
MSDQSDNSYTSAGEDEDGLFSVERGVFPLWADMNEAQKKQHSSLRDAGERDSDRYLTHFF